MPSFTTWAWSTQWPAPPVGFKRVLRAQVKERNACLHVCVYIFLTDEKHMSVHLPQIDIFHVLFLSFFPYNNLAELNVDRQGFPSQKAASHLCKIWVKPTQKKNHPAMRNHSSTYTCVFNVGQTPGSVQLMTREVDVTAFFRRATEHCQLGSAAPSHSLERVAVARRVGQ